MSAVFFLKFRGHHVKLHFVAGQSAASLTDERTATPFISEADAWTAAVKHHLQADFCEVVSAQTMEAA